MESIQSKLSVSAMTAYFGIFKEPRGLIRILQFIFAIFAFATACNGRSSEVITIGAGGTSATATWSYPYNLQGTNIVGVPNSPSVSDANDIKPSAEFFVFTGVTAMLLSLAFAVVYVVLDRQYRNDERLPIADFVVCVIWTIFWFAGSAAWAKGVSNIRSQTTSDAIAQRVTVCQNPGQICPEVYSATYANIIVSVIFGFLNFILWAGCAWFVYKETKFFKSRTAQQQPQAQPGNFSDISSPNIPQHSQARPPGSIG